MGRGIGTSIKELTELLIRLSGKKAEIEYMPAGQTFVTNRIGATENAAKDIGFQWSVDLESGMKKLIEWRAADVEAVNLRREGIRS